ncbi:transporter substrate-binding domain-containing protein [soil metagenome]
MKIKALCGLVAAGLISVMFGTSLSLAQDCTPKHKFPTVEEGFLTIAPTTYAPYSWLDDAGEVQGIDGDILKEIAKMECLKIKAVPADPAGVLQYVISGKADATTGDWYRTEERARVLNLSAPLYVDQMAIYSTTGIETVEELIGKEVGSVTGNLWIGDVKKLLGDNLKIYPVSINMQQDLEAGRISVALDGNSIGVVAQKNGALKNIQIKVIKPDPRVAASMEAGQGTFPLNKKNPEILKAFDEDIKELHDNGKIAELLVKHGLDASAAETGAPRLIP